MRRVVITGLGVVAANGTGKEEFLKALKAGTSGVRHDPRLAKLNFRCHVSAIPQGVDEILPKYLSEEVIATTDSGIQYGCLSAIEAWKDAQLTVPKPAGKEVDWDSGLIYGVGVTGLETFPHLLASTEAGHVRRLGSSIVERIMTNGVSAKITGILALGNYVSTNSTACATGTDAIVQGYRCIQDGTAERMVCGSSDLNSQYSWAGFDSMRVLSSAFNDQPDQASRPMSGSASGFVPGAGGGALVLESLEQAQKRGARIYAEICGATSNSGGQRNGGSITGANVDGMMRCIQRAIRLAKVTGQDIDLIAGHLSGTLGDPKEVHAWATALGRSPKDFPLIISTKSMIGHTLAAAGSIETVAAVLMLHHQFVHPSLNAEDLRPEIQPYAQSIPLKTLTPKRLDIVIKGGFGFGDVNSCLVLKRWNEKS